MFHHIKELQYDARVSEPDPRFASMLLEQFGGGNGELKAAMQYFVQAFAARKPYPEHYDVLMDIATEELSHLEVVGATIQMLLDGVSGELKDAAHNVEWMKIIGDDEKKDEFIHEAVTNPQFLNLTGGGVSLTDSQGNPWTASYVTANGDLTVDLRSNIAAESRAKIVYEYLMQFTDDPEVKGTLEFLMSREIAHFRQFHAALEEIQPNFPPGIMQGDPDFNQTYFNMSNGEDVRGPWNEGDVPLDGDGEEWTYVEDPVEEVVDSQGQKQMQRTDGQKRQQYQEKSEELSQKRSDAIKQSMASEGKQWSSYGHSRPRAGGGGGGGGTPSSSGQSSGGQSGGQSSSSQSSSDQSSGDSSSGE